MKFFSGIVEAVSKGAANVTKTRVGNYASKVVDQAIKPRVVGPTIVGLIAHCLQTRFDGNEALRVEREKKKIQQGD